MGKFEVVFSGKTEKVLFDLTIALYSKGPKVLMKQGNRVVWVEMMPYLESFEEAEKFVNDFIDVIERNIGTEKEWKVREDSFYGKNRFGITYTSKSKNSEWWIIYTKHPKLQIYRIRRILNSKNTRVNPKL